MSGHCWHDGVWRGIFSETSDKPLLTDVLHGALLGAAASITSLAGVLSLSRG
jgi:hypothetical protein